jgi:hypothetical protein
MTVNGHHLTVNDCQLTVDFVSSNFFSYVFTSTTCDSILLSLSSILILLAYNRSTTFVYAADLEIYPLVLCHLISRANLLLKLQVNSMKLQKAYSEAIGKVQEGS